MDEPGEENEQSRAAQARHRKQQRGKGAAAAQWRTSKNFPIWD